MSTEPRAPGSRWTEPDGLHLELRGLAPPTPMVMILRELEAAAADAQLIVHLERDPLPLYPELAERGWGAQRLAGAADEVRLRLARAG